MSYGFIIELSRNEKLQNYIIILSHHTDYLHLHLTCLLLPCLFFSLRFLNMWKPRTTFYLLWWANPSGLAFCGCGPACLLSWLGMVKVGWLGSMQSEPFLQMKFIIFQGCSTKQAVFLPGQHIISYLISHFYLFQNAIFHKMLKLGFRNFKAIFLRMQLSLVAAFFFSSFSHLFGLILAS